eukprot:2533822-Amphidinium_carterae.2
MQREHMQHCFSVSNVIVKASFFQNITTLWTTYVNLLVELNITWDKYKIADSIIACVIGKSAASHFLQTPRVVTFPNSHPSAGASQ